MSVPPPLLPGHAHPDPAWLPEREIFRSPIDSFQSLEFSWIIPRLPCRLNKKPPKWATPCSAAATYPNFRRDAAALSWELLSFITASPPLRWDSKEGICFPTFSHSYESKYHIEVGRCQYRCKRSNYGLIPAILPAAGRSVRCAYRPGRSVGRLHLLQRCNLPPLERLPEMCNPPAGKFSR